MFRTHKPTLLALTSTLVALSSMQSQAQQTGATQIAAQSATDQLPPIVVEGATLQAKPVTKPTVAPKPQPVVESDDAPAPAPKKSKKAAAKASTASGQPTTAPSSASAAQTSNAGDTPPTGGDSASDGAESSNGAISADKIGSAVSVVTGEQLRARQIRNGADALRALPGIAVTRDAGFGGLTQVRIRGAEGNHTTVLIDGIEANDTTNGEFNFSDLSADEIERIEVIRGPQSGLYGSGAIGGVVNIVTRSGRGPLTVRTFGEAGSFNTVAGGIAVSGGTDKAWGSFALSERKTGGFDIAPFGIENDGSQLKTLNIRGGVQLIPGVTLDVTLRHTNKDGDRDTQAPFPDPSGIQVDDPARFKETTWLGAARLTWESFDGHLVQVAKATRNETKRDDRSEFFGTPSVTENDGARETYSYAATYRLDTPSIVTAHHYFTGLVEHDAESFTPKSDFGFGFAADGVKRRRELDAVAFEYRGEFADRLFVQGTVRHDDSNVFGGYDTWRTAASLRLPEIGLRPHASYGTGIKLPSMFENFGSVPGSYYANPSLQAEESKGWDAGVELTLVRGVAVVDVTYFDNEVSNKIRSFANCIPGPPPFFGACTAVNDPAVSTRDGIEVEGRFALGSGLNLGLAYTYTDARTPLGMQEIRRPQHSARGDLSYVFDGGRGNVNLSAQYVADNIDTNFGTFTAVTLDPYWLVNVAAAYRVAPGVEIFGRVENLLDANYQEVYGFETAGVAAYAGVRFTYEEPSTKDWIKYK
jgi:vitamin B12 transporter